MISIGRNTDLSFLLLFRDQSSPSTCRVSFCRYLRSLESPRNSDHHQVQLNGGDQICGNVQGIGSYKALISASSDRDGLGKEAVRKRRSPCTTDWRSFLTSIWRCRVLEIGQPHPLSERGTQDARKLGNRPATRLQQECSKTPACRMHSLPILIGRQGSRIFWGRAERWKWHSGSPGHADSRTMKLYDRRSECSSRRHGAHQVLKPRQ
jgi:hypothetical protein